MEIALVDQIIHTQGCEIRRELVGKNDTPTGLYGFQNVGICI